MLNEKLALTGQVGIVVRDVNGNIKDSRDIKNLVVNKGLAYIASRVVGTSKNTMSHMALGSGTTAAAPGQTDVTSVLGQRESIDPPPRSGRASLDAR